MDKISKVKISRIFKSIIEDLSSGKVAGELTKDVPEKKTKRVLETENTPKFNPKSKNKRTPRDSEKILDKDIATFEIQKDEKLKSDERLLDKPGYSGPVILLGKYINNILSDKSLLGKLPIDLVNSLKRLEKTTDSAFKFASSEKDASLFGQKDTLRDLLKVLNKYSLNPHKMPIKILKSIQRLQRDLQNTISELKTKDSTPGTKTSPSNMPGENTGDIARGLHSKEPQGAEDNYEESLDLAKKLESPKLEGLSNSLNAKKLVKDKLNEKGNYDRLVRKLPGKIVRELEQLDLLPDSYRSIKLSSCSDKLNSIADNLLDKNYDTLSLKLREASDLLHKRSSEAIVHEIPSIEKIKEKTKTLDKFNANIEELKFLYDDIIVILNNFKQSYNKDVLDNILKEDESVLSDKAFKLVRDSDKKINDKIKAFRNKYN